MKQITGTLIWYYYICQREVWLMAHEIEPSQDNVLIELGRILSEDTYQRDKKEYEIGNIKIDLLRNRNNRVVIGEVKKSSKFQKSATMQLVFYLYKLKQQGIEATGELLIPKERKKIPVVFDYDKETEIEKAIVEIGKIIDRRKPPVPEKIIFCNKCAYHEFCWS